MILSKAIGDEILTDTDNGTFRELQDKIDAADEGGTVYLENDYVIVFYLMFLPFCKIILGLLCSCES